MKRLLGVYMMLLQYVYSQQLPVTIYSAKEGSSRFGAQGIFQDRSGVIWMTNGYEVIRYDGAKFRTIHPVASSKMELVYRVLPVGDEVWVTASPCMMKVVGDSLTPVEDTLARRRGFHLVSQASIPDGNFLLTENGVYKYLDTRLQPVVQGNFSFSDENPPLVPFKNFLLTFEPGRNLIVIDHKERRWYRIPLLVTYLNINMAGDVYVLLNNRQLHHLNDVLVDKKTVSTSAYFNFALADPSKFVIDRQNTIWLYEQSKRLLRLSADKKLSSYDNSHGLPNLSFSTMIIDRENQLWVTTEGGVYKINPALWERLTTSEGLFSNTTTFLAHNRDGDVYIGSRNGVNVFSHGRLTKFTSEDVQHLICTDSRIYYVKDHFLYSAPPNAHSEKLSKRLTVLKGIVTDMFAKNNILFVTTTEGVFCWYDNGLHRLLPDVTHFRKIFVDTRNNLWLAEFAGRLRRYTVDFDTKPLLLKNHQVITAKTVLPILAVRAITETVRGDIVIGTRTNGLFCIDTSNTIRHFSSNEGLASNSIWGLATHNNITWISNAMGLSKMVLDTVFKISDEGRLRQLQNTGSVIYVENKNQVWASTNHGVVFFSPDLKVYTDSFSVVLTARPPAGDAGTLKSFTHRQNDFSFEFSANSFLDESAIQYSYRLLRDGGELWSIPGTTKSIHYSSLNPGSYEFQVKALNVTGEWSRNIASYEFRILPPFWQRPWFIVLIAIMLAGIPYTFYRFRIWQILRMQGIRNAISKNLHDDIGASLSNINILNELARRNLNNPSVAEGYLKTSGNDIQLISESLSDIVWNISPRYDQLDNLLVRMKRYAADMMDGKNIRCELIFPETVGNVTLPMDKRRDLYLIFKEAVNNLAKYSKATVVRIQISLLRDKLVLIVEDNGIGFDVDADGRGNGLVNIRQRADFWKADLQITSTKSIGTKIQLELKI